MRGRPSSWAHTAGSLSDPPVYPCSLVPHLGIRTAQSLRHRFNSRKAERYVAYLTSDERLRWKAAAAIWTPRFFWDAESGRAWGRESGRAPTSAGYWLALREEANLRSRCGGLGDLWGLSRVPLVPPLPGGLSAGGLDGVIGNPPLGAGEAGGAGMAELDTSRGGGAARRRRAVGHRCPRRECGREGSTASLCMFDRASGGGTARRVLAVARAVHPPVVRRPTTTCCSASSPLISWARPAWRGSW